MARKTVRAAGGVVWRAEGGTVEVAVVHRPRYDDWSLPKGKLDEDEHPLLAAVREVSEELGATVAVQRRLASVDYLVLGAPKSVDYWVMRYVSGEFVPNDEVDAVEWLAVEKARELLSYDVDRGVLADFASVPPADSVVVLVRHAKAGKRTEWQGEDAVRPLDPNGVAQADRLAVLLRVYAPQRVVSADRVRCTSTVAPLAAVTGVEVEIDRRFDDEFCESAPEETEAALLAFGRAGTVTVVSSQGFTIPTLVESLGPDVRSSHTRKGAWWVLTLADGAVVAADGYSPPS